MFNQIARMSLGYSEQLTDGWPEPIVRIRTSLATSSAVEGARCSQRDDSGSGRAGQAERSGI
jgi:hypothetical protein